MYTQNNSNEMKTVVETFLVEEVESLIYDNEQLERWNSMVDSLALVGQRLITKPDKSPIPFIPMNESLQNVFKQLCPRNCEINEFSVTPIPVEILDLVALSVREKYFSKVEVWWDDKTPDPAVVGFTGVWQEMPYYHDSLKSISNRDFSTKQELIALGAKHPVFHVAQMYLIGKWADVKHSFEELKEMAKKRFVAEKSVDLKRQIKDAQRQLEDLSIEADESFG
jgi:hypothetical protein